MSKTDFCVYYKFRFNVCLVLTYRAWYEILVHKKDITIGVFRFTFFLLEISPCPSLNLQ